MDFAFTSEQDMLRDTVARLIREQYHFDTRRKVAKSDAGWRPQMWAQFAELGLLGASFPESDGGFGGGPIEAMIIAEEFGKGLVIEPWLQTVVIAGGFLRHGLFVDLVAQVVVQARLHRVVGGKVRRWRGGDLAAGIRHGGAG